MHNAPLAERFGSAVGPASEIAYREIAPCRPGRLQRRGSATHPCQSVGGTRCNSNQFPDFPSTYFFKVAETLPETEAVCTFPPSGSFFDDVLTFPSCEAPLYPARSPEPMSYSNRCSTRTSYSSPS